MANTFYSLVIMQHQYFLYITTNFSKTVLYTGVTNNLEQRLKEHYLNKGDSSTFAGKFWCYNLVYFERYNQIHDAISREKQIKGWSRKKKMELIEQENVSLRFLNEEMCEVWPPIDDFKRSDNN
jgi:putative endonuclease